MGWTHDGPSGWRSVRRPAWRNTRVMAMLLSTVRVSAVLPAVGHTWRGRYFFILLQHMHNYNSSEPSLLPSMTLSVRLPSIRLLHPAVTASRRRWLRCVAVLVFIRVLTLHSRLLVWLRWLLVRIWLMIPHISSGCGVAEVPVRCRVDEGRRPTIRRRRVASTHTGGCFSQADSAATPISSGPSLEEFPDLS